jgi:GDP-mannose 6-dehydrogenase
VESAYTQIAQHGRQQVALFGLAFKQGTDDLRESPFVSLSERLIGRGYPLRIFDQAVEVARLTGSNRAYIEKEIPHLGRLMAESPAAALAGSPLVVIGHIDQAARPDLFAALADQVVIDLAGIPELRAHRGIRYQGICGG